MSALAQKLALSESNPTVTAPDGTELKGLPREVRATLQQLWSGSADDQRAEELREWESNVRLALRLGSAAVPAPPVARAVIAARMAKAPAVARQGNRESGWGAAQEWQPTTCADEQVTAWRRQLASREEGEEGKEQKVEGSGPKEQAEVEEEKEEPPSWKPPKQRSAPPPAQEPPPDSWEDEADD
eukprot:Hpha_TRINITY_DN35570_c0_g1::TRINITY_DN35570_c0_g1_i1::g.84594::m.84594